MKNSIRKFNARKFRIAATKLTIMALTLAVMSNMGLVSFAAEAAPSGADTTAMSTLVTVVFWVVRIFILAIGGIPSTIKLVQGQTDENPRDRNAGIAGLVVTGAAVAATFVVSGLII